ncbi:MAG: hypothetical protein N4A65_12200 [Cohaesibacter sp.]|jgi:hypothetical protein|nr:hypothetical protein [Cohaesibacter sp.]
MKNPNSNGTLPVKCALTMPQAGKQNPITSGPQPYIDSKALPLKPLPAQTPEKAPAKAQAKALAKFGQKKATCSIS